MSEILETMDYGPAPESITEAREWADARGPVCAFVNGAFTPRGALQEGAESAPSTPDEIAAAVAAARAAAPEWAARGAAGRAVWLHALSRAIEKRAQFLAALDALETGRLPREARAAVAQSARLFAQFAGQRASGLPFGVVAALLGPGAALAATLAPALAAGNCVVLKPSARTPLAALALAELCAEIGLPAGVFNLVPGDESTGAALAAADIDRVVFSGRVEAARALGTALAGTDKALSLDTGVQTVALILEDADIDAAAAALAFRPVARVLIAEAAEAAFAARHAECRARLRIGDPLDRNTDRAAPPPPSERLTFRTVAEAIQLANATPDAFAASIWSESLTAALETANQLTASTVRVNSSGTADTPLLSDHLRAAPPKAQHEPHPGRLDAAPDALPLPTSPDGIDQTALLRIGGATKRPESGQSYRTSQGLAPLGTRKDIRNAVEAAAKADAWPRMTGHARAQTLFLIAETLAARRAEFEALAPGEIAPTIAAAFEAAALADAPGGRIPAPSARVLTLDTPVPRGILGIACQNTQPLLGLAAPLFAALSAGNRVVAIAAQDTPLAGLALGRLLDDCGLPPGAANVLSGPRDTLARSLATHDEVAMLWHFGDTDTADIERACADTLKPHWTAASRDWSSAPLDDTAARATGRKTIWLPFGL